MDIRYDSDNLKNICTKYGADYLGVFGSAARGESGFGSDVDILVRFAPENRSGLFAMSAMRDELEQLFERKVDLLTEGFLSRHFRDEVISETKTLYAKTQ